MEEGGIDAQFLMRVLVRRKWLILLIAVGVFCIVAARTLREPKVYGAAVSMIIDSSAPKYLDNAQVQEVAEVGSGQAWYQKEYYETQYKVITSRSVAMRVVDRLGLQTDPLFLGVAQIKDPVKRRDVMQKIDAASLVQNKIAVVPVKDSRVVMIQIEDGDAKVAALLANEVANAYIAESLALKTSVTESASKWLEDRLATLDTQSKSSDLAIFDFKKQADMLTTSLEDRQSMVSSRLSAINTALTEVRLKLAGLSARVDAVNRVRKSSRDRTGLVHWAEALPTTEKGIVSELKLSYTNHSVECAELKDRYLEGHPKVVACQEKLETQRAALVRALETLALTAQQDLDEALSQERNLSLLLDQAKAEGFEVNKKQIEFDRLKRESDNNQRLYDVVLKRLKDIELSGLLRQSNVRILDAARPSFVPVRPNVRNALTLGLLLGLLVGFGVGLGLEYLDDTVKNQQDVEGGLQLPFLGLVPRFPEPVIAEGTCDLFVFREPKSAVAESCRAIRTNLLFMTPDKPFKTLLITSSGPREGKSTTAINLAIAMAQSGNRVLLVDTDMRRPRLHKAFGIPNEVGISSVVVGEAQLKDAVRPTEVPGLSLLPCGPIPPNPAELLHTKAFHELMRAAGERFDRIILDSPPVNAVADALVLATQVDGVMLVFHASKTARPLARKALRGLSGVQARIFGAVLNEIDRAGARYGYSALPGYGYSYDYGEKSERAA